MWHHMHTAGYGKGIEPRPPHWTVQCGPGMVCRRREDTLAILHLPLACILPGTRNTRMSRCWTLDLCCLVPTVPDSCLLVALELLQLPLQQEQPVKHRNVFIIAGLGWWEGETVGDPQTNLMPTLEWLYNNLNIALWQKLQFFKSDFSLEMDIIYTTHVLLPV
jgi:hypothetical protein